MSAARSPAREWPGSDVMTCVSRRVPAPGAEGARGELRLVADAQHRRLRATVDMDLALQLYNVYR